MRHHPPSFSVQLRDRLGRGGGGDKDLQFSLPASHFQVPHLRYEGRHMLNASLVQLKVNGVPSTLYQSLFVMT